MGEMSPSKGCVVMAACLQGIVAVLPVCARVYKERSACTAEVTLVL